MSRINIGIVVEFNPFHNGHKYFIEKIRKENPNANIIAVMSGNFVQRGELSIYDKWIRAETGINNGVDIIIEIPPFFVLNNANIFANKAISILKKYDVKKIYFGSENLDISAIKKYSDIILNNSSKIKELSKKYHSLPRAISHLLNSTLKSNDLLGICYLIEAKKMNWQIEFNRIERIVNNEFTSASKIRSSLLINENNNHSLVKFGHKYNIDDYSEYIFGKLVTVEVESNIIRHLKKILLENKIKSFTELIDKSVSKNFTKSNLRRELLKFVLELKGTNNEIILAMNSSGKQVLKNITNYEFRHKKTNLDNLKVESFICLKDDETLKTKLSKNTIFK